MSDYTQHLDCIKLDSTKTVEEYYHLDNQFICKYCGSTSFQVYGGPCTTAIECSICGTNPTVIHEG